MFILYLSTLSCSLDDEDGALFIFGLRNFNVVDYHPQPPGYTLYIFFGKIALFFMKDELLALTTMSAIFGALSLVVFYFLVLEMFDKKTALMSAIILGVTPLFWLNSLKAMSDITGLFFVLFSMYFIYEFIKYKKIKSLYMGGLVSGLSMGVRLHSLFIVIPLLLYACFKVKDWKKIVYCLIFFILGILIWLIPTFIINGFLEYSKVFIRHFFWVSEIRPSLLTKGFFRKLTHQFRNFFKYFLGSGYGIDLSEYKILPVIFLVVFLSFILLSYWKIKDRRIIFFIIGLFFYFLYTFLSLPLHNPRYFLPLIPLISLLFVFGISWFNKFDYLAFIFLIFLLFFSSLPLTKEIHEVPSPSVQLINYIKENYNLDKIVLFHDAISKAHLEYYALSAYPFYKLEDYLSNETIFDESPSNKSENIITAFEENKTILIIDPDYGTLENYNLTLIKEFKRDFKVHAKQNYINLYEIKIMN